MYLSNWCSVCSGVWSELVAKFVRKSSDDAV
jgi:hypothetical protein